eukprot:1737250-Amphidinium_carterae.2
MQRSRHVLQTTRHTEGKPRNIRSCSLDEETDNEWLSFCMLRCHVVDYGVLSSLLYCEKQWSFSFQLERMAEELSHRMRNINAHTLRLCQAQQGLRRYWM